MTRLLFPIWLVACSTGNNSPDPLPEREQAGLKAPPPPRSAPKIPGEMELSGEPSDDLRSILVISWDTVREDMVDWESSPGVKTLQSQGTRFTQAFSHFPETGISHWSLLTGVEPHVHGNVPGTGGSRYRGPTLAEISKFFGYSTAAFIGGTTLTDNATGLARGFDVYNEEWDWMRKDVRPGNQVVWHATRWMKEQEGPFFAFVHFFEAHHPYEPLFGFETAPSDGPRAPDVEAEVANYKAEIRFLDSLLPDLLDAAGEETIVLLTSDHGESFEHDYLYNHRESLWDSTMHIPFVLRGPGMEPGTQSDRLVALTDAMPTLLEMAGLPSEAKIQGQSLLHDATREWVYSITDPFSGGPVKRSARSSSHKIIWEEGKELLAYDLRTDPAEERPLNEIPADLQVALDAYEDVSQKSEVLQREVLPSRMHNSQEIERLRSLGYLPSGPKNPQGGP